MPGSSSVQGEWSATGRKNSEQQQHWLVVPCQTPEPRPFRTIASIDDPPPSSFLQVHPKPFLPHTPSSPRYTNTSDHVLVRVFQNNAAHWLYLLTTRYAQSSLDILTLIGGDSRFVQRLVVTMGRSLKLSQYRRSTLLKRPRDLRRIPQLTGTSDQKTRCVINTCRT